MRALHHTKRKIGAWQGPRLRDSLHYDRLPTVETLGCDIRSQPGRAFLPKHPLPVNRDPGLSQQRYEPARTSTSYDARPVTRCNGRRDSDESSVRRVDGRIRSRCYFAAPETISAPQESQNAAFSGCRFPHLQHATGRTSRPEPSFLGTVNVQINATIQPTNVHPRSTFTKAIAVAFGWCLLRAAIVGRK